MKTSSAIEKFNKNMVKNAIESVQSGVTSISKPSAFGEKLINAADFEIWSDTAEQVVIESNLVDECYIDEARAGLERVLFKTVSDGNCTLSDVNNVKVLKKGLELAFASMVVAMNRFGL